MIWLFRIELKNKTRDREKYNVGINETQSN